MSDDNNIKELPDESTIKVNDNKIKNIYSDRTFQIFVDYCDKKV